MMFNRGHEINVDHDLSGYQKQGGANGGTRSENIQDATDSV